MAFRAGLINRFGEIPTASKLAIEFNLRNFQSKPISRESASIPLAIDSKQDRAKVEVYVLRKMEGLAQAAYTVVNFHCKLLNS